MFAIINQVLSLLDRPVRWRLTVFIMISVVTTLLESLGLAVIFLLFRIVVRPEAIEGGAIGWLRDATGIKAPSLFLALLCGLLFTIILIKILLQIVVAWLRLDIEWRIRHGLSQRLFEAYLRGPYATVSRRSTGEIVNTVWSGVGQVGIGASNLADLISDGILVLAVNATLLYMQPTLTLVALALFGTASVLYIALGRSHFSRWGTESKKASEHMYAAVTEPLVGIKQIKTLGVEGFFSERFRRQVVRLGRLARRNGLLGQSLKPLLELLIVLGLLGPIGIMLAHGLPVVDIVPILALFGTAAYRLMPSFIRITNVLQNLQFVQPVIALVHRDLARTQHASPVHRSASPTPRLRHDIRLEGIGFTYDDSDEPVLADISMTIRRGQSVALVGPSGAGKTTLVDIILGLLQPTAGRVLLDGRELEDGCRPQLLGYVPQDSFLINDTVRRNIALGAETIDETALRRAVTTAALDGFIADLPDGLDTVVGERGLRLSGGQRQRLAIARALYHRTDVLILDESTSSLDATTEAAVSEAIHRLREMQTLIIIAHRLSTVRDCDRLFFLQAGRVADEGSFAELLARNAAFRAMVRRMELTTPDAPAIQSAV